MPVAEARRRGRVPPAVGCDKMIVLRMSACMTAKSELPEPPEAELQFDIGSTDDSLERMSELFARYGDVYCVFSPGAKVAHLRHPPPG